MQQTLDSAQNSATKVIENKKQELRNEELSRNKKMRDIAARLEVTSNSTLISRGSTHSNRMIDSGLVDSKALS